MEVGKTDAQNPYLCEFWSSIIIYIASASTYLCYRVSVTRHLGGKCLQSLAYWFLSCVNRDAVVIFSASPGSQLLQFSELLQKQAGFVPPTLRPRLAVPGQG